ncbi:MAG: SAM-dependent DNA methyltransferase [bacterium]|nr:SAM-dependent DNA methyltransferase [bacterium]
MAVKKRNKTLEQTLWEAADKLRKNMDAAEYKHIVLGLIFLKYISDACEELYWKLKTGQGEYSGADPEDVDEYRAENVFFVPPMARWSYLQTRAREPEIGRIIDEAMAAIEKINPTLRGVLPTEFSRRCIDARNLGQLIDLIGSVAPSETRDKSRDLLGRVYEYCLGQFAAAESRKGGQFYTPGSIVKLMVEMLEPYNGRVYDPCCGSGGMFVQGENFILAHQGRLDDISIYGQESNNTTYRLCRMNLAIRGIDASNIKWNSEGSLLKDVHPILKADYILANPPFNDSDWSSELLTEDIRWKDYLCPPRGNANYAWLLHILSHLSPKGTAGVVLSNGSLSTQTVKEKEIRRRLVENCRVDCIVGLPDRLFYNTGIPACLWFVSKGKAGRDYRKNEVLFIDARSYGHMESRKTRVLSAEEIRTIADIYRNWLNKKGNYRDIAGLCKSVPPEEIRQNGYFLTPALYTGFPRDEEDPVPFDQKIKQLTSDFTILIKRGEEVDRLILRELKKIGEEG